ncbi:type II toxin-antitoxin system Phd/YefM family antitoxin [Companilactobacillus kedongensis]|uniref:type II toxin-antitoxin system Phd/YefM family antitoxin n=1 Tax=Companilactobacillus kedongensis TaxID=2486004 RepID=UPI000F7B460C|nr:type II toxin-antitoxin system Phd/YefM family antitoxin [Companilactobacillus kedongensis]
MSEIKAISAKDLVNDFEKYADKVVDCNEALLVSGPENKNVVLMSEKEFDSWQETKHFLDDPELRERLMNAVNSLNKEKDTRTITPEQWELMNRNR